MNFLVILSSLLAMVAAKPGVINPFVYSSSILAPAGYKYYIGSSPVAYSPSPLSAPIITTLPAIQNSQYHTQNELGQASYGHSEAFQAHNAVQDAAGNKLGSYSYVAPDGQIISTSYVADALGYRVASNALPIGPSVVPATPSDTPEVIAARAAHLKEHALAKSRSRRSIAIATPVTYSGLSFIHSAPLLHATATPVTYSAPVSPVLHHTTLTTVL